MALKCGIKIKMWRLLTVTPVGCVNFKEVTMLQKFKIRLTTSHLLPFFYIAFQFYGFIKFCEELVEHGELSAKILIFTDEKLFAGDASVCCSLGQSERYRKTACHF